MRKHTYILILGIVLFVAIQPGIGQQDSIHSRLPYEHASMLIGGGSSFLVVGGLGHLYSSAFSDSGVSTGEILAKSVAVAVPASLLGVFISTLSGKKTFGRRNDFAVSTGWSVINGLPIGDPSKWKHGIFISTELPSYGQFKYTFELHHVFSEILDFGIPGESFNAELTFTSLSTNLQWVITKKRWQFRPFMGSNLLFTHEKGVDSFGISYENTSSELGANLGIQISFSFTPYLSIYSSFTGTALENNFLSGISTGIRYTFGSS